MKNGKSCYVEIDAYAAQWLRNLISRGLIADGDVIERSVVDITPNELAQYSQVHLYAGIGVWSYSLRRAGIPDTANVWTFSEPCQPFSAAGKGLGFADDRYLRPYTNHLIEQCRPTICLGEQVASNDGLGWLDVVQTDFERAGYACGAVDTCSASVGAPHIRQRLRVCAVSEDWLANSEIFGRRKRLGHVPSATGQDEREMAGQRHGNAARTNGAVGELGESAVRRRERIGHQSTHVESVPASSHSIGGLADPDGRNAGAEGLQRSGQHGLEPEDARNGELASFGMADAASTGRGERGQDATGCGERSDAQGLEQRLGDGSVCGVGHNSRPGATNGHWANADWLLCRDGKWRPVEPGTFPLAHGATSRVGRLRAYGNAVDAEATTDFCRNAAEVLGLR